jgi:hypothetical protein
VRFALAACVLVACASDAPSTTKSTPPTMTRPITPRSKLPAAIQPLLPQHGIYAAGGGLVSSAWRVVVDYDAKTIFGGTSAASNAPSFGPMDKENRRGLSAANETLLRQVAEDAWREPAERPVDPPADYDAILVVLDGDDTFYLQGYGPIRRPAAAKAIVELRAAAGL